MRIYTVFIEFEDRNDAQALADLLADDLELPATITYRTIRSRNLTSGTRLGIHIIEAMKRSPGHVWTVEEVADELEHRYYARSSAAPTLYLLEKEGIIERINRGTYILRR